MTKQITITMPDYIFDTYIKNETKNRSHLIQKYILLGADTEASKTGVSNVILNQLKSELEKIEHDNKNLRLENSSLKSKLEEKKKRKFHVVTDPFADPEYS
jgi:hypothetical protein